MEIIVILLGLVFGSFYNVVAYRVPRGESLAAPPSHCPQCGHRLGALELVPVLSFLWQRGRCRHCGSRVSWRYPLVEAATGLLFWSGYKAFGLGIAMPVSLVVGSLVLLTALWAWDQGRAKRRLDNDDGLTLLEVLAALAILGIVVVAGIGLYGASARAQKQAEAMAGATSLGQFIVEGLHYTAGFGALVPLPPAFQQFSLQRNGVDYDITLKVEQEPQSSSLTRVAVHVQWEQPARSSIDLVTLVSDALAGGGTGGGGGNNGRGNGADKGDKDQDKAKPAKEGGQGDGAADGHPGGDPASPPWAWLSSLLAE